MTSNKSLFRSVNSISQFSKAILLKKQFFFANSHTVFLSCKKKICVLNSGKCFAPFLQYIYSNKRDFSPDSLKEEIYFKSDATQALEFETLCTKERNLF